MNPPIHPFAVRLLREDLVPVGAGVLIANGQILTCAHVVNEAFQEAGPSSISLGRDVLVNFPLLSAAGSHRAKVIYCSDEPTNPAKDIAVLQLEVVPSVCTSARFTDDEDLDDLEFDVYGYPAGHDTGTWSKGKLGYVNGEGLRQTINDQPGYRVVPGYSGSPVWVGEHQAVAGIVVTSDRDAETRSAFIIPTKKLIELYPQLVESVQSRLYTLLADESNEQPIGGHRRIRITEGQNGKLTWRGGIRPGQFGTLWQGRSDFQIAYGPTLSRHRDVADALLRLAIHGEGGTLFVVDPDRWKNRSAELVNKCIGTRWDQASPSVASPASHLWSLQPLADYSDVELPFQAEYTPVDLAAILHTQLDLELLNKLSESASRILRDNDPSELGLDVQSDLAKEMWMVWQQWESVLKEKPELLSHFFRVMLSKADRGQLALAQGRVGLHTFVPCLLRGIIFALAIRACLPWDFRPIKDERHANIKAKLGHTHLCGLELIDTVTIVQRVGHMAWDSECVLLPHYTDSGDEIPALSQSLMAPGGNQGRLDKAMAVPPLFFTGEGAFIRALAAGKDALEQHLLAIVDRWHKRQETEITKAVKEPANGS